jgi:PPOX class probable F420-dependent enzyme
MELAAARTFIKTHHQAVLATLRPDGTPQLSPVTTGVDADGRVFISTRETAIKVKHIRKTGKAWICVLPDGFFGEWIYVEGTATILSLPDAMDSLVTGYRSISGEHPDWDDYRAAMVRDRRCLIYIELTRAGPDFHG